MKKAEIILVRDKSLFTHKLIILGMYIWQILRFQKPKKCYPHAAVKIGNFVYESISPVVQKVSFKDFASKYKAPVLKIYDYPLSESQYFSSVDYLEKLIGREYEYSNFLFHTLKAIPFVKWLGGKREKKLYCYELAIRFMNITEIIQFNPYLNPIELEDSLVAFHKKNVKYSQ